MAKTDILVLGATGYTGSLITRYLATHPENSTFTFALGARSYDKLQHVARENGLQPSRVPLIEVDVLDKVRVYEVVKDFHVVIAAVGPFVKYGKFVVEACAEAGVHYVDITGEPSFILWCIENYDFLASKNHTCIINSGGFDSVPSDIIPYLANKTLKRVAGPKVSCGQSVSAFDFEMKGGASGGTIRTTIENATGDVPERWKVHAREYALSPVQGKSAGRFQLIRRLPHSNIVGAIFPMSFGNEHFVRRTWGLYKLRAMLTNSEIDHANSYGDEFVYTEFLLRDSWWKAFVKNVYWAIVAVVLLISPLRAIAMWWLPKSGEGPSERALKDGWLKVINITTSARNSETVIKTIMEGKGEPGYYLTSVIVSEIALLLLPKNANNLTAIGREGGVLTAMSAIGQPLVDKLVETEKFKFSSEPIHPQA